MTLFSMANQSFTLIMLAELALRLIVASVCGAALGAERSRRFKGAGVRTHCIAACTAALIMIVSKYSFTDLEYAGSQFAGTRGADPSRIAAQCIKGCGFLAAGIIYRDNKFSAKGLTSGAVMWMTAVIGMAIGAGMYQIGIFATLFVLLILLLTHRFEIGSDLYTSVDLDFVADANESVRNELNKLLESWQALTVKSEISKEQNDQIHYHMALKLKSAKECDELTKFLTDNSMIHTFKVNSDN